MPVLCFSPDTALTSSGQALSGPISRQGHPAALLCTPEHPSMPSGPARPCCPWDTEDRAVPEASSHGGLAPRTSAWEQDRVRELLGKGRGPAPSTAVGSDHQTQAGACARAAVLHPHPLAQMCFSCTRSPLCPPACHRQEKHPVGLQPNGQALCKGGQFLPAGTLPK